MRCKKILKKKKRPNHIKRQWTLILKILTKFKRDTNYIQNYGGLSTKLYNNFFDETDIFPDDFIKHCKNNANESHNIPLEVKNNIKRMLMEQGLYS